MEFRSIYLDTPLVSGRVFDIFTPEKVTRDTAVFFIHGGGWNCGTRTLYHSLMEELNSDGYICASADYRPATATRYAGGAGVTAVEQLRDLREAYDAFVTELEKSGRPLNLAVFGSSAGAHLAGLLALAAPGACGEKAALRHVWVPPVKAILQSTPVSLEPWEDIFPPIWENIQNFACGWRYEDNPEIFRRLSLRSYLGPENPPCFFMEAGNEHVFMPDRTREFAAAQWKLGVPSVWKSYPMAEHGFMYATRYPVQKRAFADLRRFLADEAIPGAATKDA